MELNLSKDVLFTEQIKLKLEKITAKNLSTRLIYSMYENFLFKYVDFSKKIPKDVNMFDFLQEHTLVTYQLSLPMKDYPKKLLNYEKKNINNFYQYNHTEKFVNAIFCSNELCLIAERLDVEYLTNLFKQKNSFLINVSTDIQKLKPNCDENIKDEISAFRSKYSFFLKKYPFFGYTINPIFTFLLQRHLYPSYFFSNTFFLKYDKLDDTVDEIMLNIQKYLAIFLRSTTKSQNEESFNRFYTLIKLFFQQKTEKVKNHTYEFDMNDFYTIPDHATNRASYKSAINRNNLYLFYVEDFSDRYFHDTLDDSTQISICQHKYHPYMTPFYGFDKKNEKVVAIFYKHMSNGDLSSYITSKRDKEEKIKLIFIYFVIIRIVYAIQYLHSNSIVYKNFNSKCILLDKDLNAFLFNFDELELLKDNQNSDSNTSNPFEKYQNDILSIGLIMKELFDQSDIDGNFSMFINNIIQSCCHSDPCKRISIDELQKILIEKVGPFQFFEENLLAQYDQPEMIRYISQTLDLLRDQICTEKVDFDYEITRIAEIVCLYKFKTQNYISPMFNRIAENYYAFKEYERARKCYELLLKIDDSDASFQLGRMYENGIGVYKDIQISISYYEMSVNLNNSNACLRLAMIYKARNELNQSFKLLQKAIELNNPYAYLELGIIYKDEMKDYSNALICFQGAISNGINEAFLHLAMMHENGLGDVQSTQNVDQLFNDYIKAEMERDDLLEDYSKLERKSIALLNIGNIYCNRINDKKDFSKAEKYYKLSLECGYPFAYFNLGVLYEMKENDGLLIENCLMAEKYYLSAGEKGNSNAYFCLGNLYLYGKIGKIDFETSKIYFLKSAKLGNFDALTKLGDFYFYKIFGEVDYTKAIHYYEQSAKYGDSEASTKLGDLYFYQKYGNVDYAKAFHYYEQSAKKGDSYSLSQLYKINRESFKREKYIQKVEEVLLKDAKDDNLSGLLKLADFYQNVKKDIEKAIEYYSILAYKHHQIQALLKLGIIYLYPQFEGQKIAEFVKCILDIIHIIQMKNPLLIESIQKSSCFSFFTNAFKLLIKDEKQLNENPLIQNNLSLFIEFFIEHKDVNFIVNSKSLLQKATQKKFPLAYFNLARISENEGNLDKAIKLYIEASNLQNERMNSNNNNDDDDDDDDRDDSNENSSIFILCLTNLIIVHYFILNEKSIQNHIQKVKEFFRRTFMKIKIYCKFNYLLCPCNGRTNYSYVWSYILDSPLFDLVNQPGVNKIVDDFKTNHFGQLLIESNSVNQQIKLENPENLIDYIYSNNDLKEKFISEINEIINLMKSILATFPYKILFGQIGITEKNE